MKGECHIIRYGSNTFKGMVKHAPNTDTLQNTLFIANYSHCPQIAILTHHQERRETNKWVNDEQSPSEEGREPHRELKDKSLKMEKIHGELVRRVLCKEEFYEIVKQKMDYRKLFVNFFRERI